MESNGNLVSTTQENVRMAGFLEKKGKMRAKNRATQEEWLQALLHSMSLPLVTKTLKPPTLKNGSLGFGTSLDNINFYDRLNHTNLDNECTLPKKMHHRIRRISGTVYGGSLDTEIWSKKLKPARTPSPNIPKGKMLEKIIGFAKESDSLCLGVVPQKGSRLSLSNEIEMKYLRENSDLDELCEQEEKNAKCKVHDENQNHGLYSVVDKKKKKLNKTLSDTELNKTGSLQNLNYATVDKKDKSSFERIKNALSKIPTDKILRGKPKTEKVTRPSKKRRQSFLQKVFKKKDCASHDYESDISDPLYDTIDHIQEQHHSLTSEIFKKKGKNSTRDLHEGKENKDHDDGVCEVVEDALYSEVQKTVAGSKTILPAQTMSELRIKLKSRESLERHEHKLLDDEEAQKVYSENKKDETQAPSLPPRRVSRPVSPWHDVPTNNAPVDNNKSSFFVHKAIVKFHDPMRYPDMEMSQTENKFLDVIDIVRLERVEPNQRESLGDFFRFQSLEKNKSDDLSVLLEQLTKITIAPLAEPEVVDDNYSSDSETFWSKSQSSDPDYAIPRPHKPLLLISPGNEIISSTEFMGRHDDYSDTSSSFRSMEPDSLEMAEKKIVAQS